MHGRRASTLASRKLHTFSIGLRSGDLGGWNTFGDFLVEKLRGEMRGVCALIVLKELAALRVESLCRRKIVGIKMVNVVR